ncbi:glutaredoxin family protein [Agromyces protaetiae]|uniref:Glutaredoxin family protein n=1 Tax=Agromyces protaetiae TaxID=2509455 RepID=A0A4P6FBC6_9MICO|nr:glutaredoxin family protein [Agromyces protaetiae]QAY72283.1 glutaredoxin family protein [Agromyces protaetiae]
MTTRRLTFIGKPGCHLCDDAREVVDAVRAQLAGDPAAPAVEVEELSILDDPALAALYAEEIPVVLIDGEPHGYWRIDGARLRAALLA